MKKTILALTFLTVALIGKIVTPVKLDMQTNNAVQEIVQPQIDKKLSKANLAAASRSASGPNYGSGQSTLWTPVTQIEDGAVYMIRSAQSPNLYWDLTGGSLSNGTQVQLYECNYSHAQKFYIKKQFDMNGYTTYRISPLFAYDKLLRIPNASGYSILQVDEETKYTDKTLFNDKFIFSKHQYSDSFDILSCVNQDLSINVNVSALVSGEKLYNCDQCQTLSDFHSWQLIKTDYIGLNIGNKTWVEGTNEFRYVARVPRLGRYVIETYNCGFYAVDTYLTLKRDSDNTVVDTNDDAGEGHNAKIVYNFETIEEFSILVRGFNNNERGYCYLVFRPEKTLYFSGTYDYDNQKYDRVTPLNKCKENLNKMGYFTEVQANFNHNSIYSEQDWEGKLKIDRDYYVFIGHGGNDGTCSVYFDSKNPDWVDQSHIPSLNNTGLMLWMTCRGGKEPANGGKDHCFAMAMAMKGADYSLGFRGDIGRSSANKFVEEFFKARVNNTQESSIVTAARNSGLWDPVVFSDGGRTETRYSVSIFGFGYTTSTINHQL